MIGVLRTVAVILSMIGFAIGQTKMAGVSIREEGQTKTLSNDSGEALLAVSCVYEIESPNDGTIREVEYVMSFVGPLMTDDALAPSAEFKLFSGPLMVSEGLWVDRENIRIRGLVFASGRVAGPDGRRLLDYLRDNARESGHQLRDIRRMLQGASLADAEHLIKDEPSIVKGRNAAMVQYQLRKQLIDRNGRLKENYIDLISDLAEFLAQF